MALNRKGQERPGLGTTPIPAPGFFTGPSAGFWASTGSSYPGLYVCQAKKTPIHATLLYTLEFTRDMGFTNPLKHFGVAARAV